MIEFQAACAATLGNQSRRKNQELVFFAGCQIHGLSSSVVQ
jgi:hypothetical protein